MVFQKAEQAEQNELRKNETLDVIKKMEAELKLADSEKKEQISIKIQQHYDFLKDIEADSNKKE